MTQPTQHPMSQQRILVTGSAGAIGSVVAPALRARGHFVRGFDRRESIGIDESIVGDITDAAAVDRAVEGCDTVVHLAAAPDDAPFIEVLLQPNVVGLFRVFDACRRLGVKRIVFASTMQVVSGHHRHKPHPVRIEDGPAPTNHYALTKVWAEQMGEMYARRWGLEAIGVRLGWFPRDAEGAGKIAAYRGGPWYLSYDDAVRFFTAAVERPLTEPFHVLFALSANDGNPAAELDPAQRVLGYEPRDTFPQGLPFDPAAVTADHVLR